jgi:hypothetical protein
VVAGEIKKTFREFFDGAADGNFKKFLFVFFVQQKESNGNDMHK